jgi:putative restriction endonuclease
MDIHELLDSAHLIPMSENGNDDARNGLVLCAIRHRAFDAMLFAFDPETLSLQARKVGPDLNKLRIKFASLQHLRRKPHPSAIEWCWKKWVKASEPVVTD